MSSHPRRRRAFSLIEAVLSTFLLLTSVLMGVYVFHSSLRAEASNEKRVVAALVAESALAEIRSFAGENFPGLVDRYDGRTWIPTGEEEMTVSAKARPGSLGLACLELESQYPTSNVFPEPEPRLLSSSVVDVEVTVSWVDPSRQSVTVVETVTDMRTASDFQVELLDDAGAVAPASMPLAREALAGFRARAKANGKPVNDLQFTWFVQPVIGFGSISAMSRDGLRCVYQNGYRSYNDDLRFAPGACYLTLKATYQGRESTARIRIDNEI